jgi:hypothetical protein
LSMNDSQARGFMMATSSPSSFMILSQKSREDASAAKERRFSLQEFH